MLMNKEKVMMFLPHRDPFLFVDSVEKIEIEGKEGIVPIKECVGGLVVGNYHAIESHPIFAGHFPGNPILPGVVQVEMMAQVSAFLLFKTDPEVYKKDMEVALLSVNEAKFRKPILPGMDLTIKAVCTKIRGPFMGHDCEIYHGEELMSQASVMATVKIS